ncbi:hypothetical protein Bca101_029230 [Brassica carinata]
MPSMRIGGVALDLVGIPLSEETLTKAKNSDDVFLGAVGWPKWDNNSKHLKLNGAVAASYGSRSVFQFKTHHCLPSGELCLYHVSVETQSGGKVELQHMHRAGVLSQKIIYLNHEEKLLRLQFQDWSGQNCSCTSRKDEEEDENDKVSVGKELTYLESLS